MADDCGDAKPCKLPRAGQSPRAGMADDCGGAKPKLPRGQSPRGGQSSHPATVTHNSSSQTRHPRDTKQPPGAALHTPCKDLASLVDKPDRFTSSSSSKESQATRLNKSISSGYSQSKENCQKRKLKITGPDGCAQQSLGKNVDNCAKVGSNKVIKSDSTQLVKPSAVLIRDASPPKLNSWTSNCKTVEDVSDNCVGRGTGTECQATHQDTTLSEDCGVILNTAESVDSSSSSLSAASLEGDWRPLSSSTNQEEVNKSCDCGVTKRHCNCDGDWTFNVASACDGTRPSPGGEDTGDQWYTGNQLDRQTATGQHAGTGWFPEKKASAWSQGKPAGNQQCKGNQGTRQQKKVKRTRKISQERAGLLDNAFTSSDDDQYEFVFDEGYGEIVRRKKCQQKHTAAMPAATQMARNKPRDTPVSDSDGMKPAPEAGTSPLSALKHALPYLPERLRDRLVARHAELSSTSEHSAPDHDNHTTPGHNSRPTPDHDILTAPGHDHCPAPVHNDRTAPVHNDRAAPVHNDTTAPYHNDDLTAPYPNVTQSLATGYGSQQSGMDLKAKPMNKSVKHTWSNDNNSAVLGKNSTNSINMVKALIRSRNSSGERDVTRDCAATGENRGCLGDSESTGDRVEARCNNDCDKLTDGGRNIDDMLTVKQRRKTNSDTQIDDGRKRGDNLGDNSRHLCNRELNKSRRNGDSRSNNDSRGNKGKMTDNSQNGKCLNTVDTSLSQAGPQPTMCNTDKRWNRDTCNMNQQQAGLEQGSRETFNWLDRDHRLYQHSLQDPYNEEDRDFHTFERCLEDPFKVRDESGVSFCSGLIDLIDDIDLPLVGEVEDVDDMSTVAGSSQQMPPRCDADTGEVRKPPRARFVKGQASGQDQGPESGLDDDEVDDRFRDELLTVERGEETINCRLDKSARSGSGEAALWQSGSASEHGNEDDVESCGEADDEFECDCEACCMLPHPAGGHLGGDLDRDLGVDLGGEYDLGEGDPGRRQRWEEMRYGAEADLPSPESLLGFTGGLDVGLDLGLESLEPNSLGVLLDSSLRQIVLIESVIQQMLTIQPDLLAGQAAPPAPLSVIEGLPTVSLTLQHTEQHPHCPICLSPCEEQEVMSQLPCQHLFHPACVHAWLTKSGTCPVCRQLVTG